MDAGRRHDFLGQRQDFFTHYTANGMSFTFMPVLLVPSDLTRMTRSTQVDAIYRKPQPFIKRPHKNLPKSCPIGRQYSECQRNLPFLWRETLSLSSKAIYSVKIPERLI